MRGPIVMRGGGITSRKCSCKVSVGSSEGNTHTYMYLGKVVVVPISDRRECKVKATSNVHVRSDYGYYECTGIT